MADRKKLEQAARLILEAIGEDPNREGLLETPRRFAEMMEEQTAYTTVSNEEIAREFGKTFSSSEEGPVVVGLSKVARIADAVSRRLQIQERIGADIRTIIEKVTGSPDVIVRIDGEHSCMTARGIKKPGAVTTTISSSGKFNTPEYRQLFKEML